MGAHQIMQDIYSEGPVYLKQVRTLIPESERIFQTFHCPAFGPVMSGIFPHDWRWKAISIFSLGLFCLTQGPLATEEAVFPTLPPHSLLLPPSVSLTLYLNPFPALLTSWSAILLFLNFPHPHPNL